MKKILLALFLLPVFGFCDTKISALPSTTTLNSVDIIPVVTNPSTAPGNFTITKANLISTLGIANGIPSINSTGNAAITSSATLNAGTNVTLGQLGNTITVNASGSASTNPAAPFNAVQFNSTGTFNGSSSFTTDGSSVTVSTMVINNILNTGITTIGFTDLNTKLILNNKDFSGLYNDGIAFTYGGLPNGYINQTNGSLLCSDLSTTCMSNPFGFGSSIGTYNLGIDVTGKISIGQYEGSRSTATVWGNMLIGTGYPTIHNAPINGLQIQGSEIIDSSLTVTGSGGLGVSYGAVLGSATLSNVTGTTQCLHTDSSGHVTGTGSDCGGSTVLISSGVAFGSATNTITQDTNTFIFYDAALPQPKAPTVTPVGTTGAKIYFYTVVPIGNLGYGRSSTYTTISNSNNSLSGTNYNTVQTFAVAGATSCDIFRSPDLNTTPTGNYIFVQNVSCGASYNDIGTSPSFSGTVGEGGFTLTDQSAGLLINSNAVISQSLTVGTTQVAVTPEGSSGATQFSVYQVLVGSSSPISDPTLVSLNYTIDPNGYGVNQPWIMQNTLSVPSSNGYNIPALEGISNNVNDNGSGTLGSADSIIGNLTLGQNVTQPIASIYATNFDAGNFAVSVASAIKSGPAAVYAVAQAQGTGGTVSRLYAYRATMGGAGAGQTITNAYSYYASTPTANGMTNYEGLHLEDGHAFGTSSSYGVHVAGKGWNSLFDGGVTAGTMTITGSSLTINGVLMAWPSSGTIGGFLQYASTNTVQWGTPAGGGSGGITALTGDVTASGSGSVTATAAATQPNIVTLSSTGGVTISSNAMISGSTFYQNGTTIINGRLGLGGAIPTAAITLPGSGNTINSLGDISITPAGLIQETAGNGISATNAGSSINFATGVGNTTGAGGSYIVTTGAGGNAGNGGAIQFQAGRGNGLNTNAGDITFQGARSGNTGSGTGTNIKFEPGNSTAGSVGNVRFYDASLGDYAYIDMTNISNDNPSTVALTLPSVNGTLLTQESATTGSGAALLGSNSPASTLTAPATWIKVRLPDDSDGYIPVWK